MLSKNDLIYFGAMMLLAKYEWVTDVNEDDAIEVARQMFDKVWNDDGNDKMILE